MVIKIQINLCFDLICVCLLVNLKHNGDVLPKNYKFQSCIRTRISKPEERPPFDVRRHLVPNIHGIVICRDIGNDCRGFNNLSYTIHLR